jgi:mannose/cellobiose epimerase-like protein (N-acyl-D-glucosamine 2-epimerase family)
MFPKLRNNVGPLLIWTKDTALPFWGTVGLDEARGGFHERLDLRGRPVLGVSKRLMVQGRQLYVYSRAAVLGWYPDAERLARRSFAYLLRTYYQADGRPGWVYSISSAGEVDSSIRDLYAHSFVLLGLAEYYRLTWDQEVLQLADTTMAFLDDELRAEKGYLDAVPPPDRIRRQNPHMHLFEAFINLYDVAARAHYLDHAVEMFNLFATSFFQEQTGTLCEYLTEDLEPLACGKGRISEPGHEYEWVWLLRGFERISGRRVDPYCSALYEHAERYGWDEHGFIIDEIDTEGTPVRSSRRTWPHAEGLKANIAEGEAGRKGCDERAARCAARLAEAFLARPVSGGWIDRLDADSRPISEFIPASTLYHVFCGIAEAARATSD